MKFANKECYMCGMKLSKSNYYPAFDIENCTTLEFCCRDCYERYTFIMEKVYKEREKNELSYNKHKEEIGNYLYNAYCYGERKC